MRFKGCMPLPINKLTCFHLRALVFTGLIVSNIYNVYAIGVDEICNNGIDDDGDGILDEFESMCIDVEIGVIQSKADISNVSINIEICLDGVDNNRNGETDEEPCTEPNMRFEYCNNNADDDLDGKTDEPEDCIIVELCNNGMDDDGDGILDEQHCILVIPMSISPN